MAHDVGFVVEGEMGLTTSTLRSREPFESGLERPGTEGVRRGEGCGDGVGRGELAAEGRG